MKPCLHHKKSLIAAAVGGLVAATLGGGNVYAAPGVISDLTSFDINESKLLKDNHFIIGGWANAGITYNSTDPGDRFNGPVTFGDRASEFQLNQLNLFLQRTVATEGDAWDFGGRFDAMFGTDSIFTQAYGVPAFDVNNGQQRNRSTWDLNLLNSDGNRFYDIALPQAYLETYIPVGNGLNVKLGHFYTPIGYETVPAPDNFFYTHAYTMQYGEPFTHTGALGNYTVNKNWALTGGVITGSATGGWDGGFNQQLGNWGGIAGVTWTSDDAATSFNAAGTFSSTSEQSDNKWALYSLVLKHNITDKTHLIVQHDHGYANNVLISGVPTDAQWYGINTHLYYDIKDDLSVGVRGEWFRDQNGFRVCSPGRIAAATNNDGTSYAGNTGYTCQPATYYAVTAGLNYKPKKWITLRPNVRYDMVDGIQANGITPYRPFDGGNKTGQFLFSTDFTISF